MKAKEKEKILKKFHKYLLDNSEDLPEDICGIVNEHFWDLFDSNDSKH